MRNSLVSLGILSTSVQLYLSLWPDMPAPSIWLIVAVLGASLIFGVVQVIPRESLNRTFASPRFGISIVIGDLFDQDCHIAVGFTDTFDTDIQNERVIHPGSVQAQLVRRIFPGSTGSLDQALDMALAGVSPISRESRSDKVSGKLDRYPIPTVAAIRESGRIIYCVAYSRLDNNFVAQSSVNRIWDSLDALWNSAHQNGQRATLAVPIFGSELARVDSLDRESLIRMILLSFVARSRGGVIASELRIVIHPNDRDSVNMLELQAFVATL